MSKQFLVTQIPLTNTVVDLWRMVFEYNSGTVVNLEDVPSFEEVKDLYFYSNQYYQNKHFYIHNNRRILIYIIS